MPGQEKLSEFVGWSQKHITGDEKGQAQIFLERQNSNSVRHKRAGVNKSKLG